MKKYILMVICLMTILWGCGEEVSKDPAPKEKTNSGATVTQKDVTLQIGDSIKGVRDSLNCFIAKMDTIVKQQNQQINNIKNDVDQLRSDLQTYDSISNIVLHWGVPLLIIFILAIVLLYVRSFRKKRPKKTEENHPKNPEQIVVERDCVNRDKCNDTFEKLKYEIGLLNRQVAELQAKSKDLEPRPQSEEKQPDRSLPKEQQKIIYFNGVISGAEQYFTDESKDRTDALYGLTVKEDNNAEFIPMGTSFGPFSSADDARYAIDFKGDKRPDARMTVIKPGHAKKEKDRWIVKEKAQVKLS